MKLLYLVNSLDPKTGGTYEFVRLMAQWHAKKGDLVDVVSVDSPETELSLASCRKVYLMGPAKLAYGYSSAMLKFAREQVDNYDLYVCHGLWQFQSFACWRACKGRLPYVIFPHGMLDPWFNQAYPLKAVKKAIYFHAIEKKILEDAGRVIFTAEDELQAARKSFGDFQISSSVVNPGIEGFNSERDKAIGKFYQKFSALQSRPFILYLGRLHAKKGLDLLIEAFAQSVGNGSQFDLVIAGPDSFGLQADLEQKIFALSIEANVHFTGMLEGELKWGALLSCQALVLPSHQENFGIVVAEALSCAKPVLITNRVNIWQEVRDYGAGLIADDSQEGICKLMEQWNSLDIEQRKIMESKALECFQNCFDINTSFEKLRAEYQECIKDG